MLDSSLREFLRLTDWRNASTLQGCLWLRESHRQEGREQLLIGQKSVMRTLSMVESCPFIGYFLISLGIFKFWLLWTSRRSLDVTEVTWNPNKVPEYSYMIMGAQVRLKS